MSQDLRFAFRQIFRNPGFSLTAVLSLMLGIGATVAVYSILYDAVLHPWPYAGIDRVVDVWITDSAGRDGTWGLTGPQIRQLRQTRPHGGGASARRNRATRCFLFEGPFYPGAGENSFDRARAPGLVVYSHEAAC